MGYDEKTAERVRRLLSRRRDVVEKKMVGGLSFMVNGSMCCGLTSTALMVRVGPEAYEGALAQPHTRPMEFTGKPLAGFVCVDSRGYRTDTALAKMDPAGHRLRVDAPSEEARGEEASAEGAARVTPDRIQGEAENGER